MADLRNRWLDAVVAWQCYQSELSEPARVMLLHLGRFMAADLTVRRSQRKLAEELAKERRTIRAYVAEAVNVGFLVPEERAVKDRRTASYRGAFPPVEAQQLSPRVPLSARPVGGTGRPPKSAEVGGTSGPPDGRDGAPTPKSDSGRDGMTPLLRRPTGSAASQQSDWVPPEEPPDGPEVEEMFPADDRGEPKGTPEGQRAGGPAEVLEQGDNSGPDSRVTGSTSRPSAPVAEIFNFASPDHPHAGSDTAVPPPKSSRPATSEHDGERKVS